MGFKVQGGLTKGSKEMVTVLQNDGRILEFPRALLVADLLYDHPKHSVCHSSVLLSRGRMLPLNAILMRGEVYFLLPLPTSKPDDQFTTGTETVSLLASGQQPREETQPKGTMKFLITKKQLAKIRAEASIKVETKEPELPSSLPHAIVPTRSTSVRGPHRPSPTLTKRQVTWSPGFVRED